MFHFAYLGARDMAALTMRELRAAATASKGRRKNQAKMLTPIRFEVESDFGSALSA
jgi:hypothetical protein